MKVKYEYSLWNVRRDNESKPAWLFADPIDKSFDRGHIVRKMHAITEARRRYYETLGMEMRKRKVTFADWEPCEVETTE